MPVTTADQFLPVELVFNPRWWHQTAGIAFDQAFYLDAPARIRHDVTMRRVLYERYGDIGLGEPDPQPRPVIGSPYVAGGFAIPALLGAEIRFAPDAAPQPLPVSLTTDEIAALDKLDYTARWPVQELLVWTLEAEYGYVVGDVSTDGLLNAAYHLYGQDLFLVYGAPERVARLLDLIGGTIIDALAFRARTGAAGVG